MGQRFGGQERRKAKGDDSEMAPQAIEIAQNGLGNGAHEFGGRGQGKSCAEAHLTNWNH
jgi:hypothetical protein